MCTTVCLIEDVDELYPGRDAASQKMLCRILKKVLRERFKQSPSSHNGTKILVNSKNKNNKDWSKSNNSFFRGSWDNTLVDPGFFLGGGRVRDLQTPLPHGLLKEKQKQAKTVILGVGVGKRPWMKTRMKTVMMKMRMKTVYLVRCGQLAYPPVDVMATPLNTDFATIRTKIIKRRALKTFKRSTSVLLVIRRDNCSAQN